MSAIREVYPYLIVRGAAAAIEFYRTVFGAEEIFRLPEPETGRIGHAELKLGPMTIMLADEYPELGIRSPLATGAANTAPATSTGISGSSGPTSRRDGLVEFQSPLAAAAWRE